MQGNVELAEEPARRPEGAPSAALRRLFEAEEAGLAILDAKGRILATNAALARMLEAVAAPSPPAGTPAQALFALESQAMVQDIVARALVGPPVPPPVESRFAAASADPDSAVEVICRPLRGEPGALLRVADITARRRIEAQLAENLRMQSVGRLAGGIAHDFNNLLTAIIGSAQTLLARSADRDPQDIAELQQILDSADRGARLVRHLLAFARQQALQPRLLSLSEAVSGIQELLQRLLGTAVRLEVSLAEAPCRVRVDPAQLDQVILNLVVNARDAMPGGGLLRLTTREMALDAPAVHQNSTVPPGCWAVLEVTDTGIGISPEALARLFEPFFTTRRDRGGTGLGLSTVHGIVRQSGGHLTVETRLGEGTRFTLWLPLAEGEDEAPRAQGMPLQPAAAPLSEDRRPLLLVEDEAPLRRLAERALARAGFAVQTAEDAHAALLRLPEGSAPPAVLVTDVTMPGGMDGVELARRLRRRFPDLPVLLVSGYGGAVLELDLESEGLRLLPKPYRVEELVAAVSAALSARAAQALA